MEHHMIIDGIRYTSNTSEEMPYVIVRTQSAGVFAGYLKSRNNQEVELLQARRLWYWSGAASLSELSVKGVRNPQKCKFPCEVPSVQLFQTVEILPTTKYAQDSIAGVPIWTAY